MVHFDITTSRGRSLASSATQVELATAKEKPATAAAQLASLEKQLEPAPAQQGPAMASYEKLDRELKDRI